MDALLARLSLLEDQVRSLSELPPIVAQLSSANEAQLSTNARLSSENEALKIALDDQYRSLVELSRKTAPEGHWLCERGKERKGGSHWIWSSEVEKYKSLPITAAGQARPLTSLESLPVELLSIILSMLSRAETAAMCSVSMMFLKLASKPLYRKVKVDMRGAALLLESRLSNPSSSSFERVHPFLIPTVVLLQTWTPSFSLDSLARLPIDHPLPLQNLAFAHRSPSHHRKASSPGPPCSFVFSNPRTFNITSHRRRALPTYPQLRPLQKRPVFSLDFWTRLDAISCTGGRSLVYLGSEEGGGMAFKTCLERCVASALGRKKGIETSLSVGFEDGSSREMEFEDDKELKTRLVDLRGGAERLVSRSRW